MFHSGFCFANTLVFVLLWSITQGLERGRQRLSQWATLSAHSPLIYGNKVATWLWVAEPRHSCSNGCSGQHPNPCLLGLVPSLKTEVEPWSPPCTDPWNPWVPGVSQPCSGRWLPPSGGLHPLLGSAWAPPSGRGFLVPLAGQSTPPACRLRTLGTQAEKPRLLKKRRVGHPCAAPTAGDRWLRSSILSPRTLQSLHTGSWSRKTRF